MVTEPIFCSLSDWMTYFNLVPDISEDVRDVVFSELEIKHGLLQVTYYFQLLSLSFLVRLHLAFNFYITMHPKSIAHSGIVI